MMKNIFWVEDEYESTEDFNRILMSNFSFKKFKTYGKFIEKLVELKQNNKKEIENMILMLDIMIPGEPIIYIPEEWCKNCNKRKIPTDRGYKAGIVFYKHFILDCWEELYPNTEFPPVVFLATIAGNFIKTEIQEIEVKILKSEKGDKVKYINKWNPAAKELLIKTLKQWSNQ